jgi:tRNA (guanine-N7-)-methyltransferase
MAAEEHHAADAEITKPEAESQRRPIRSFVLRQGRVSAAQQRAYTEFMPRYGITYAPSLLNLDAVFQRDAPRMLEIGFGMGETTAAIAAAHPELDYLGVEVHTPGVGGLLKLIAAEQLRNVRVIQHDVVEVLQHMIPAGTLAGVHIFFPDPWPKARHHKRRLVQPDFVRLLASRLQRDGYVHAATDWEPYAQHMLQVLTAEPDLCNTANGFAQRPDSRPLTKFERRGLQLGHPVWDLMFRRSQSTTES